MNNDTTFAPDVVALLLAEARPDTGILMPAIYYATAPQKPWSLGGRRHWLTLEKTDDTPAALARAETAGVLEREYVVDLLPLRRGEADASTPPEPLGLLGNRHLGAQPVQRGREFLAGAGVAADDHPVDSGASQQAELPGRQRPPSHGHERLREAARGVAEPLGLATRQNDRFHYSASSASTSGVSGSAASGDDARPMPS